MNKSGTIYIRTQTNNVIGNNSNNILDENVDDKKVDIQSSIDDESKKSENTSESDLKDDRAKPTDSKIFFNLKDSFKTPSKNITSIHFPDNKNSGNPGKGVKSVKEVHTHIHRNTQQTSRYYEPPSNHTATNLPNLSRSYSGLSQSLKEDFERTEFENKLRNENIPSDKKIVNKQDHIEKSLKSSGSEIKDHKPKKDNSSDNSLFKSLTTSWIFRWLGDSDIALRIIIGVIAGIIIFGIIFTQLGILSTK